MERVCIGCTDIDFCKVVEGTILIGSESSIDWTIGRSLYNWRLEYDKALFKWQIVCGKTNESWLASVGTVSDVGTNYDEVTKWEWLLESRNIMAEWGEDKSTKFVAAVEL